MSAQLLSALRDGARLAEVAGLLDHMAHAERVAATRALGRTEQRALYRLAADSPPLNAAHFVPADRSPLEEVRHHGTNTLPLPAAWRAFQKRFCRPEAGSDRLYGYNESPLRGFIGPGFFVAVPTGSHAPWVERGPWVIDYFQVPDSAVTPGWPRVIPNSRGVQVLVYNKTRDFMRRVSSHVSIGAAFKVERSLDHYFTLVREDG